VPLPPEIVPKLVIIAPAARATTPIRLPLMTDVLIVAAPLVTAPPAFR
jgi:hypothetical protein